MSLLNVIVPCYNEEENIVPFFEELMKSAPAWHLQRSELELR